MTDEDWLKLNHANWDERAPIHARSGFYDVEGFLSGKSTLGEDEEHDLGDVCGKSLLHLQCHFGLDTLSWARRGARVTGLDFSEKAILEAQALAKKANLEANFICANVYDTPAVVKDQFDIVYTGIGAICWLPDIDQWAEVIARMIKPGGIFYMVEIHPMHWVFADDDFTLAYDYFSGASGETIDESGSYADASAKTQHNTTKQWNHNISDVVTALINAGLTIEFVRESDECAYKRWPNMIRSSPNRFRLPEGSPNLPLMYTVKAKSRQFLKLRGT